MSASPIPLERARSFLFVPADRLSRLPKALDSGAHVVIIDLEDAVAPSDKCNARNALESTWTTLTQTQRERILVRVNALHTSWHEADIALVRMMNQTHAAGVVVPKAESVSALCHIAEASGGAVLPLIESVEGLHAVELLARVPAVSRLAFGHLDFQVDAGLSCGPEESELDSVRMALVFASRRSGLPAPVDGVTASLDDELRLDADTDRSRRLGFGAKLCIHPKQIGCVNSRLGPSPSQQEWATRVLAASAESGPGAFRFNGEMVDAPVLARARRFLDS